MLMSHDLVKYAMVICYVAIEAMAIEIVDFPVENGDFPVRYVYLPEGIIY